MNNKEKILLISLGRSFFKGALWGAYDFEFPLNVGYVTAFLEKNRLSVDVIDLQIYNEPFKKIENIDFSEYFAIGINSDLANTKSAYQIAEFIKSKTLYASVFAFGVYTKLKDIILKECQHIDYVVYGEEENTIRDLSIAILNKNGLQGIKGIVVRENEKIIINPSREYEQCLDSLPFPARSKFYFKKYFPSPGKYYVLPQLSVLSSRGCNWHCFFCSNLRGKGIRFRSPENVVNEIEHLQNDFNAREINFIDDTFTADKQRVLKFVELVKKLKKKIYIRVCSRIDTVDREILEALKETGLYSIGYGIESGVDKVIEFNQKGITTDMVRQKVNLTKKLGLEVRGFFMLNLPGDTVSTTEQTVKFIKELDLDLVNVQITYPWPYTEMREYIEKNYNINKDLWDKWEYCDGDDVLFTQSDLSKEYLLDIYRKIIRDQYLNSKFIFNWVKRIRSLHDFKYSFLQFVNLLMKS